MLDANRESQERDTKTESNEPKCCGKGTQAEEREGEAVTGTHTEASRGQDLRRAEVTRERRSGMQWTERRRE